MTASHARSQLRHRPTVTLARVESILPYWSRAGKASSLASVSGNDLIRSLFRRNTNGQPSIRIFAYPIIMSYSSSFNGK